jgi:hypothetical protein
MSDVKIKIFDCSKKPYNLAIKWHTGIRKIYLRKLLSLFATPAFFLELILLFTFWLFAISEAGLPPSYKPAAREMN